MKKLCVAIFLGGSSREREISFFGGRTVFDNIDKSRYDPVLIFIDEFRNFIKLKWQYIYKGSIQDFYSFSKEMNNEKIFKELIEEKVNSIGEKIFPENFKDHFDFAFLTLHGSFGENGSIQGLLDWYNIPYSGSKILGSAIGLDKVFHKNFLKNEGFDSIPSLYIKRENWLSNKSKILSNSFFLKNNELVVKSSTQGSSIGVYKTDNSCIKKIEAAIDKAFFVKKVEKNFWQKLSIEEKKIFCLNLKDFENEIGYPISIMDFKISFPEELIVFLNNYFEKNNDVLIEGLPKEKNVVIEKFISGREFTCIVLKEKNKKPVALPPTEIIKEGDLFSFDQKYLPGSIKKKTPIDISLETIKKLCSTCVKVFEKLNFSTYARIDGIILNEKIFINDPNTTVGMLPSAFIFQQAAMVGINPKQLITFIIENS